MAKQKEPLQLIITHDAAGKRREYIVYKRTWKYVYCYAFDHERAEGMGDHFEIEPANIKETRAPTAAEVFKHQDDRVQALIAPAYVKAKQEAQQKKEEYEKLVEQEAELKQKMRAAWTDADLAACHLIDAKIEEETRLKI